MEKMNIDEFFKEKLIKIETEFEEDAWEDLEAQLDKKERKDRVFVWWWHWEKIAAVLVIGFWGYVGYYFTQNPAISTQKNLVELISKQKTEKTFSPPKAQQKNIESSKERQELVKNMPSPFIQKHIIYIEFWENQQPETHKAENFDRDLQERNLRSSSEKIAFALPIPDSLNTWAAHSETPSNHFGVSHSFGFAFSPVISPSGLQAGLGYTHELGISEKTSIVSGLAYTPWTSSLANNLSPASNLSNALPVDASNIRLQTLEIPLEAKIKITEKLSVSSGVSNTLLLQEKIGEAINNEFEWSISSLNVGLQYDLRVSKNSYLNLQPYYRFPLQSVGSAGTQISGFGLRAGYSYGKTKKQRPHFVEN